ncbi:MAG: DUF2845 domain-containing protein [Halomonadaceae bacterium]|nr:MAG: DUF2845 domain-containing protein [Halomonadaceae bacterium]
MLRSLLLPKLLPALSLSVLLAITAAPAEAFRCNRSLVGTGDLTVEVKDKCGSPDYRSEFDAVVLPGLGPVQATEHWYYNEGPQRFIRRLTFRNGRLRHLETLGRGFVDNQSGGCTPRAIERGMSEYELYQRCGPPLDERREWQFGPPGKFPGSPRQAVPVQEWLYDFGGQQFRRLVTIRGGDVVAQERRDKPR